MAQSNELDDYPHPLHNPQSPSDGILNGDATEPSGSDRHSRQTASTASSRLTSPVQPRRVPRPRVLNKWDVASLIINKMIGTGIFTAPSSVLQVAKSPGLACGLWLLGFLYTGISLLVYLEFARKLPHTGGELIYLDETLPGPNFLAYTIYAFYFVIFYNNATNSMRFADYILRCATDPNMTQDERLTRLLAVVILTFICVVIFRSSRITLLLGKALAALKIVLLLVVLVAGAVKARDRKVSWSDQASGDPSNSAAAFLLILFSYGGWENATFVAGEIEDYETLKQGFIIAVSVVGTLYTLVNVVFLKAIAYSDHVTNYAPIFFGNSLAAQKAWDAILAISAAGSLLSVIYAAARVKLAIGRSNAFPWSRWWALESKYETPEGGLLLHWIFSVILIAATAAITSLSTAISFPGNLQAYATGVIRVPIAIGFIFLGRRDIPGPKQFFEEGSWTKEVGFFTTTLRRVPLSTIYIIFNLYIVIVNALPPYTNTDGTPEEIMGWYYGAITGTTILAGALYYFIAFGNEKYSAFRFARAKATIMTEPTHDAKYGFRKYVVVTPTNPKNWIYRFFGGTATQNED